MFAKTIGAFDDMVLGVGFSGGFMRATFCWKLRKEKPILAKYNLILDTTAAR